MTISRSMRLFAINALVALFVSLYAGARGKAAPSLVGKWNIHGRLVTSIAMNNPADRNSPKEGQEMIQTWKVTKSPGGLALITPKGVINGTSVKGGAHFAVQFPANIMGAPCQIRVTINMSMIGANKIVGNEELLYFMYNGLAQLNPVPGREAWKFSANRIR